jgi:HK97 family phage major capsid protein/HK97 family phage prohead protease
MKNRAFGVLEVRAVDEEQRIVEGIASTNVEDAEGTIVEPRGAKFNLPMPLLWQHDVRTPVGHVISASVENDRIRVRAQILKIDEAGPLRDLLDRAWQSVKHGLVRGFSVGFLPIKQRGNRFTEWDWRELSLVTLPSTPGATIELVRSAFGGDPSPGVSGTKPQPGARAMNMKLPVVHLSPEGGTMQTREKRGIGFARAVMALARSKGNRFEAGRYAVDEWGPAAGRAIGQLLTRAAVAPGTTSNATFAAPLVPTVAEAEFLELLRPATLIGRIANARHVPLNVAVAVQTGGGTYKWVGQNQPKPVTNAQYASAGLTFAKASGIIVITEELARLSTPSAEASVRDEMIRGCVQFLDAQFVDSTVAAVAGVNPASITNGVTGAAASAATPAAFKTDIAARIAALMTAGYPPSELVILMSETVAFNMSMALNNNGGPSFPGLTPTGGSLFGIPVVASQSVGAQIVVAHGPSLLVADEDVIEIDVSRQAAIQMDSAPDNPPVAASVMTSLWQLNLVGIRVDRLITWGKARANSVDRITAAAYVP